MAFTSAIVTNKSVKGVHGWQQHIEGTWDADSVVKGEIDLSSYISRIDTGVIFCTTGTAVTKWGMNVDADGAASAGSISVLACTANDEGGFWAEGPLA